MSAAQKQQTTGKDLPVDMTSNDPDMPNVEREGPAVEQPKMKPEQQAPANGGVERQDKQEKVDQLLKEAGEVTPAVIEERGAADHQLISVKAISESPLNPRKLIGDLSGMISSMVEHGVLSDLTVRPNASHKVTGKGPEWELVLGHRRLRAAAQAGLVEVPCIVRDWNDTQCLSAQLAENIERQDLTRLEELDGLYRLHMDGKLSCEDVGKRVGKSERWVQTRIQLMKLGPEARSAYQDEKVDVSSAILLASVPSHKLQAEALEIILKPGPDGEPMSFRESKDYIKTNFSTELRGVAFDRKNDLLVPEAGPCTTCPKRTANNPELLSEYKRADVCTDVVCFKSKLEAHWEQERAKAKEKGMKSLSIQQGRQLFKAGHLGSLSEYIDLGAPCSTDKRKRTWNEVLGDKATDPDLVTVTIAPDAKAHPHRLVARDEALQVAKKAGVKWAAPAAEQAEQRRPATREEKAKRELDDAIQATVEDTVIAKVVEQLEDQKLGDVNAATLRLMCMALASIPRASVLERRELKNDVALEALIKDTTKASVLFALAFEMCVSEWSRGGNDGYSDALRVMAKLFKVDIGAIERAATTTAPAEALFDKKKRKGA